MTSSHGHALPSTTPIMPDVKRAFALTILLEWSMHHGPEQRTSQFGIAGFECRTGAEELRGVARRIAYIRDRMHSMCGWRTAMPWHFSGGSPSVPMP